MQPFPPFPFTSTLSALLMSAVFSTVAAQDCYNTSTAILLAQLETPPVLDIVLCPNTIFPIGVPANPEVELEVEVEGTQFVGGDVPFMAIHDNMTFSCGADGSSDNLCVLSGGVSQFTTLVVSPLWPVPITTHNLLLKGLTFTGTLVASASASEDATSQSILFSAPGDDMIIDDCVFVDLTGIDFVVANIVDSSFVHSDPTAAAAASLYPPKSQSLTIRNSVLKDIVYDNYALYNYQQRMNMENLIIENVTINQDTNHTAAPQQQQQQSIIRVIGGDSNIMDSSFRDVDYFESIAFVGGTEFTYGYSGNVAVRAVAIDPTLDPCDEGLIVQINATTQDCLRFFDNYTPMPTSMPASASASASPTEDACFGICGPVGTLTNRDANATVAGPSGEPILTTCDELDMGIQLLPPGPICEAGAQGALEAGCLCTGIPTAAPVIPTPTPTTTTTSSTSSSSPTTVAPTLPGATTPAPVLASIDVSSPTMSPSTAAGATNTNKGLLLSVMMVVATTAAATTTTIFAAL